jgi:hypothetical protein
MEVKQEAAQEVMLEVKDQPPSPPRGHLPASCPTKRAWTEMPPQTPSLEPWRAAFSIPIVYRCPINGEWGYTATFQLSEGEADIIVINDDGGASADVKGKAPL